MTGKHAAPRSWGDRRPTRASRRHRAPSRQPVAAVLLVVTGGALGLVAALPGSGAAVAPPAPTAPAAAPLGIVAYIAPDRPTRASRSRVLPLPTPSRAASAALPPAPKPAPPPPDPLPGCTASVDGATRYANGRIPVSALCRLPGQPGHALRADAARAYARLSQAHQKAFGSPLCLTDSYRSLSAQRTVAWQKPRLAARPGTSVHGSGLAVDLACGAQSFGTDAHRWLERTAGAYGWSQPSWAQRGGNRPEPWHWEYRP